MAYWRQVYCAIAYEDFKLQLNSNDDSLKMILMLPVWVSFFVIGGIFNVFSQFITVIKHFPNNINVLC